MPQRPLLMLLGTLPRPAPDLSKTVRMLPISADSACFPCRAQLEEATEYIKKVKYQLCLPAMRPRVSHCPSLPCQNCHGLGTYYALATVPSVFMISFHSDIGLRRYRFRN